MEKEKKTAPQEKPKRRWNNKNKAEKKAVKETRPQQPEIKQPVSKGKKPVKKAPKNAVKIIFLAGVG